MLRPKRRLWKIAGLGCLIVLITIGIWLGPLIYVGFKRGIIQNALSGTTMRKYHGDREDRLKAIRRALMLYEDSEGAFPPTAGWMDKVQTYIQAADMTSEESAKKLHDPAANGDGFGFALNDAVAGKYHGDIKDGDTVLVFTSQRTDRSAHGSPKTDAAKPPRDGENVGITLNGNIVHLP